MKPRIVGAVAVFVMSAGLAFVTLAAVEATPRVVPDAPAYLVHIEEVR